MTQGQLAKRCGWASQSRVGNYENDSREPTLGDLKKIASVLGIHVLQLIDESAYPASSATTAPHYVNDTAERKGYAPSPQLRRILSIAADLDDDQLKLLVGIAEVIRKG